MRDNAIINGVLPELMDELIGELTKFNCPHLRWRKENGRRIAVCSIYEDRPDFCRNYPAEPGDLIEGCGYRFL